MQRVFWRAIEARGSCNCAICTPIRPGLTRKVNTLPVKRRLKFGDVVNIVYGTVLGTAALYDGTSKKQRREKIDDALIGLLLQNEEAIRDQEARLKALGYDGSESASTLSEDLTRSTSNAGWMGWGAIFKRPSLLKSSSSHARHYSTQYTNNERKCESNNDGRWGAKMLARQEQRVLDRLRMSSQSQEYMESGQSRPKDNIASSRSFKTKPEARVVGKSIEEAWEDITLIPSLRNWRTREMAVTQLVLKLLKTYFTSIDTNKQDVPSIQFTNTSGFTSHFECEDLPDIIRFHKEVSLRMDCIKRGIKDPDASEIATPFLLPKFRVYRRNEGMQSSYHWDIMQQNDHLVAIFLQADNSASLISELCAFLVAQRCGPNIHTMNLLLLLFLDIQWYQACKAVISTISVLAANQNEVTDIAKLQYYHLTQQDLNLDAQRAFMLCLDGRSTRAAFTPGELTTETFQPEQVLIRTRIQDGMRRTSSVVKAGWTAEAFSIVIIDLLDRGELTEAFAEIATMRLSGLQETPDILEAMLQYSVFKQDWDVALKSWTRFEELSYAKSILALYWMLQACATCQQTQSFYKLVSMGTQQGILRSDIEYSIEAFDLPAIARDKLKRKTHALQRLKHRISIPRLPQRDLHVLADDVIQMPNLEQTMLMVYLQYAKLRKIVSRWFVDHLNYLCSAEMELQNLVESLLDSPKALQDLEERWTAYGAKLEAFATTRNGGHIVKNVKLEATIKRMMLNDCTCTGSEQDVPATIARTEKSPATSTFYETCSLTDSILSRTHEEKSNSGFDLLEETSLSQSMFDNQQSIPEYRNSLTDDASVKTHVRFVTGSLIPRRILSSPYSMKDSSQPRTSLVPRVHPHVPYREAISKSRIRMKLKLGAVQPVEDLPVLPQNQRSAQKAYQDDDDIDVDMNEAYTQKHWLTAVA